MSNDAKEKLEQLRARLTKSRRALAPTDPAFALVDEALIIIDKLQDLLTAKPFTVGLRGCCAQTRRGGVLRHCAQKAIVTRDGLPYCHYHDPLNPHKFGERIKNRGHGEL